MQKTSLPLIRIASLLLIISLISACTKREDTRVLRMAHALSESHPVHEGIVEMGRVLDSVSEGKLQMKIYANAQLGSERELMELLQIGSIDISKVSGGALENFVPAFSVLALPYIFNDSSHLNKVLHGPIGRSLLDRTQPYRMHGLCFYDAGRRSFYTKTSPVMHPEDLTGLKVRVMNSKSAIDMVSALGGTPTPISYGELYTALDQGIVDAAENNPPSFYTSRHYEICKFYSIDEHSAVPDVVLISLHTWESLSSKEQEWVQFAASSSVPVQAEVWDASVQASLDSVRAAGVEIVYPEKEPFQDRVKGLYEQSATDPELAELINQIQAVR